MTDIKPIETRYAGCRFRSRIEARWAVFFDHLGIGWEYEPQGFQLPSGLYLPDFWLPNLPFGGVWFEVKGQVPTQLEMDLAHDLAQVTNCEVIISAGGIPWPSMEYVRARVGRSSYYPHDDTRPTPEWLDEPVEWCVGWKSGLIGIAFHGDGALIADEDDSAAKLGERVYTGNHPRLLAAYRAARSARFEHGESA